VPTETTLPKVGDRVGSFEILGTLGSGGMGAVYLASDLRLDRLVALKILPPELTHDTDVVARFEQEGRATARLDHENIARVYTLGSDRGLHFIAFEYIQGTTIRQLLEERQVCSIEQTVGIALQICEALVHASRRGVVHRDIKPSNIIVTPAGRAKLVDMGLARSFERGARDAGLTQSGMTLGTFDYISPEQARDPRDVDVRSDLYSLGCTLFHMLTGRPPFPEGTVLQKLLQHQEEPAPDPRTLSPQVPSDFADAVLKLMEKDRDQRFQRPEDLARSLSAVANRLGLPQMGHVEFATQPLQNWERHLIWALPVLGLVVVLAFILMMNQNDEGRALRPDTAIAAGAARPEEADRRPSDQPQPQPNSQADSPLERPGLERSVGSSESLADAIRNAPSGATLLLTDDGPYEVDPQVIDEARLGESGRDLTIKSVARSRPVVMSSAAIPNGGTTALLAFTGGRVRLEGLEFQLAPAKGHSANVAVLANNVQLSVTRCLFRGASSQPVGEASALLVRSGAKLAGELPASTRLAASAIGPGLDGMFSPHGPLAWFDNSASSSVVRVQLALRHLSVIAGDAPVLRFHKTAARVLLENSVIAAASEGKATLVASDLPNRLDWVGRENLYGRVGLYVQSTGDPPQTDRIASFNSWANAAGSIREMRSLATDAHVWAQSDPLSWLPGNEFTRAYELDRFAPALGSRQGPRGMVPRFNTMLAEIQESARGFLPPGRRLSTSTPSEISDSKTKSDVADTSKSTTGGGLSLVTNASPNDVSASGLTPPTHAGSSTTELPPMIPVTTSPMPGAAAQPMAEAAEPDQESTEAVLRSAAAAAAFPPKATLDASSISTTVERSNGANGLNALGLNSNNSPRPKTASAAPISTPGDLHNALVELAPKGGTLRFAADARLEVAAIDLPRGRWTFVAEPGIARPRLTFAPEVRPFAFSNEPSSLFRLGSGVQLEVRDIDFVLAPKAAPLGRWAAFLVAPGSDLVLTRCTVTSNPPNNKPDAARTSVIQVSGAGEQANSVATFSARIDDCLIRTAGNILDVSTGLRAECGITNSILACEGSVLHARGAPRGHAPEPLKLVLRQCAIRALAGLVWLETSTQEAEIPLAEVNARESILTTGSTGTPLLRIEGQNALDELRDRISWEGHGVVYHQIETYRRDDSAQAGTTPLGFRRLSWQVAVGPREDAAFHGDAGFVRAWPAERGTWTTTPEDFRLAPTSPVPMAGPQIDRIPAPPRIDL
jgi:serine/threonine-protein kinase